MMNFSPFSRRLLAIGLVIIPLLIIFLYIIFPVLDLYKENEQKIYNARFVLTKYQAITLYKPRKTALDKKKLNQEKVNFISDSTEALASASLQSRLKTLAARHRVTVLRANKLASRSEKSLTLIGIRLELIGTQKDLKSVLYKIENNRPYLFIDKLDLKASPTSQRNRDLKLTARLHIYSAFQKKEGLQ